MSWLFMSWILVCALAAEGFGFPLGIAFDGGVFGESHFGPDVEGVAFFKGAEQAYEFALHAAVGGFHS